jgi:trimethylamine--corrinoid protein Co-methyltransferase
LLKDKSDQTKFLVGATTMTIAFSPLRYLSEQDIDHIKETAFRILEEIGVSLVHARAREMLHGHGCRVEKDRVFIPRNAAKWGIENVSPYTKIRHVDGTPAFDLGDGVSRFHNTPGLAFIYDPESGQRRPATTKDHVDATRLLDALENVDIIVPVFGPQDVPDEMIVLVPTEAALRNTNKPLISTGIEKPEDVPYVIEMAAACCGGMDAFLQHPTVIIPVSPVSPLTFSDDCAEAMIVAVELGAPLMPVPCPALGSTAPITLAGALAQQHAELLTSFLIAACTRQGVPVKYTSRICSTDLGTGRSSWGGPEIGVSASCGVQIGHRLGLPTNVYGLATNSASMDLEFAYQRMANALLPAIAGADIITGVGSYDNVSTGDHRISVLDNEIISIIRYASSGCQVNDETLALDAMEKVIPRGGVFLASHHTVENMRKGAVWVSPSARQRGDSSVDLAEWADARKQEILNSQQPKPLPDDVDRHLNEIMAKAWRDRT